MCDLISGGATCFLRYEPCMVRCLLCGPSMEFLYFSGGRAIAAVSSNLSTKQDHWLASAHIHEWRRGRSSTPSSKFLQWRQKGKINNGSTEYIFRCTIPPFGTSTHVSEVFRYSPDCNARMNRCARDTNHQNGSSSIEKVGLSELKTRRTTGNSASQDTDCIILPRNTSYTNQWGVHRVSRVILLNKQETMVRGGAAFSTEPHLTLRGEERPAKLHV